MGTFLYVEEVSAVQDPWDKLADQVWAGVMAKLAEVLLAYQYPMMGMPANVVEGCEEQISW